jgi:hypothetical protein
MEATAKQAIDPETCADQDWIEQELAASTLPDAWLEKRLQHLVERMAAGLGRSIPLACQDCAAIKAAYRFFSNERICEEQILARHLKRHANGCPKEKLLFWCCMTRPSSVTSGKTWPLSDWSAKGPCVKTRKGGQCTSPPVGSTCTPVW